MKPELSDDTKKIIDNRVFFKFVAFNKANEEEMNKTLALSNFLKEDGERIFNPNSSD
tara:strand:+ start:116 stop:286 length:171 start_codon:yes stop_codon:yes gene_type:complete